MRARYDTAVVVLGRSGAGEGSTLLTLLTLEVGLVRAHAQGIRLSGAKLAPALTTLSESEVTLVRGREMWRIAGASLTHAWATRLVPQKRAVAGRVAGLLLRLAPREEQGSALFELYTAFLAALETADEPDVEALEILAALRSLALLGHDQGIEGTPTDFSPALCAVARAERRDLIARVNHAISTSGL